MLGKDVQKNKFLNVTCCLQKNRAEQKGKHTCFIYAARVVTNTYIPLFKLNRKLHMYLSYTFPLLSASS